MVRVRDDPDRCHVFPLPIGTGLIIVTIQPAEKVVQGHCAASWAALAHSDHTSSAIADAIMASGAVVDLVSTAARAPFEPANLIDAFPVVQKGHGSAVEAGKEI